MAIDGTLTVADRLERLSLPAQLDRAAGALTLLLVTRIDRGVYGRDWRAAGVTRGHVTVTVEAHFSKTT